MIRGLIFDFDGLVADTESAEYQSWQELFAEYDRALPLAVWSEAVGAAVDAFDALAYLESLLGRAIPERLAVRDRRRHRYLDLVLASPVLPGVRELLAEAKEAGLRLGLASSSSREWVVGHLTRLGLVDYFDCFRTSDDVASVKPDPGLYLAALEALSLRTREAIALEDSPSGIQAAKAAGLYCVAIPNPLTAQLELGLADRRLTSMADVRLEDLVAEAERALAQGGAVDGA